MPRISVVIPSYNHARFIEEAIDSVVKQTYSDLELIIVDDASTDESPDLIREALSKAPALNARLIEQENTGTAGAIARGVSESQGELVSILNSDDRYTPERFERLLDVSPAQGDFLAFSGARMIDAAGFPWPENSYVVKAYRHGIQEAARSPTIGFALLRNNFATSSGNALFTRSLYEKIGGFAPYELASDWDFLLRSLLEVEPIFIDEPLFEYRTHSTNTRLSISGDSASEEGRTIINAYFAAASSARPPNPMAPCEANWPVYFDLFVSRYHAWFGSGPIREWMEEPPAPLSEKAALSRWGSWSGVADFERSDDCDYLTSGDYKPGEQVALALAREVVVGEAHPLDEEEGPGEDAWLEAFARARPGRPEFVREPWPPQIDRSLIPSPEKQSLAKRLMRRSARILTKSTEKILPGRVSQRLRQTIVLLRSGLFQSDYYRFQTGLRGHPIRLCWHYLKQQEVGGFNPHPLFDREFYLRMNPGLVGSDMDPLVHYLEYGGREGCASHPLFDSAFYLRLYPDVAAFGMNPLSHYIKHGAQEGRIPHIRFDPVFYEEEHETGGKLPLLHYAEEGRYKDYPVSRRHRMRQKLELAQVGDDDLATRNRDAMLRRKIRISGCFDDELYSTVLAANYADSHIHDPLRNFLELGAAEGVPICTPERMTEKLETLEVDDLSQPALSYLQESAWNPMDASVALYVSSLGNTFFREITELLAHGFRRAGARVQIVDENEVPPEADSHIVVAPHEFFLLGRGTERLKMDFLRQCSIWIAEQPGSEFFSMCLWFARFARGVLDINPLSALLWSELGFHARALPLGFIDDFEPYQDQQTVLDPSIRAGQRPEFHEYAGSIHDDWNQRPLDVFYNAVLTERRDQFIARNSYLFSELECAFFMPTPNRPLSKEVASALTGRDATAFGQRARIQLNIHRSEFPYFEWHRLVVRGIWQKTVVITEPSFPVPGFLAGEHYFESELEDMPSLIEWLLQTPDGQAEAEAVRQRAFKELTNRYDLSSMTNAFLREDLT